MYVNRKIRPTETMPGMGEGDKGELMERLNSTMI
jgi:hypothetical protein